MKQYLLLLAVMIGFSLQITAEELSITGNVQDEEGIPVSSYEVFITTGDSTFNFFYSNIVLTNDNGDFSDQINLPGDLSQGEVLVSVMSCNEILSQSQYFNPSNYELNFDFTVCTDPGNGGNDTIEDCQNFFYYDTQNLTINFFGMVFPQDDNTTYTWNFGDGTSGTGIEIAHEYAADGDYEVTLNTVSGDDCSASSTQIIFFNNGGNDTIEDCQNFFYYDIQNLSVNFFGMAYPQNDNTIYTWEFGDGITAEGMETTHTYTQEGEYEVILTTTLGDCIATSSQTIILGENTGDFTLFGNVYVDNTPLDYGIVIMHSAFNDSIGNDGWCVFNMTVVNTDGSYAFENIPDGDYLIIAFPDEMSAYFESHFPTYYGDVIFWEEATSVTPSNTNGPLDINLVQATGTNVGEGIINGEIIGEGFKSQLENTDISLFLIDENNQPLTVAYSEDNGTFDFSNIEFGTYTVYAEVTGLPTEPAQVTLSSENPTADISIEITPNGVISGIEGLSSSILKEVGNIYPNPVTDEASFEISLKTQTIINIYIYNQIGQLVQSKTLNAQKGKSVIQLETSRLLHGVYSLKLVLDDGASINQKFIK